MDNPRKHEKKKQSTTMPAGSFGIGGIVLFGGALVAATLVSAFAIKTRRRRPSSSDAIKKSRSQPPEPETVDALNPLKLTMKINTDRESSKDFAADSSSLELQNPSDDGVTGMKAMQTTPTYDLIPDEKQNSGMDKEEKESTTTYVDSGFQREEIDVCGKIPVEDCEEQVVVAAQTDVGFRFSKEEPPTKNSVISAPREDGGEEQKYSTLIDDENDDLQTDSSTEEPLVSKEPLISIEEDEAIERVGEEDQAAVAEEESSQCKNSRDIAIEAAAVQVALWDDVAELVEDRCKEILSVQVVDDQETVYVKDAAVQEEEIKDACVHRIEVEDSPRVQFLEEKDGHDEIILEKREEDIIDETGFADQIVSEQVTGGEEAIDAACLHQIEVEDDLQVQFLEEDRENNGYDEIILKNCEENMMNETSFADQIVSEQRMGEEASNAACVHQIEVEDSPQVHFLEEDKEKDGHDEVVLENHEEDMINKTGFTYQIVSQQVIGEEEAIAAACVHHIEVEDGPQVQFHEEKEKDGHDEMALENCEEDMINETGFADQIVREENQQLEYNSELVVGEEEAIKAACVEDILEMAHHEVALEDVQEMHARKVREAFSSEEHSSTAVAHTMNMNDSLKLAVDDQIPPRELMNKEEKGKETAQEVEEKVTEDELVKKDEIPNIKLIEEAKNDDRTVMGDDSPPRQLMNKEEKGKETAEEVQAEMITEEALVKEAEKIKEDGIPHVQLIEEDEEANDDEEDVTMKTEVSSNGTEESSIESNGVAIWPDDCVQEEQTPERRISNQKTEENMKGDQTILQKEQNDSDHDIVNEEDGSKSASSYGERYMTELPKERKQAPASEPWKLRMRTWSVLVSIWCLCHWYSELPFPELSLVGSLLFILILLSFRNRATYLVKYE